MDDDQLVNRGCIVRPGGAPAGGAEGRTFIISGVARSGTTLAAAVLHEAGLYLGTFLADVVHEDRELLAILRSGQRPLLGEAIARRDAAHRDWGFKIPNIHAYLHHTDLARFRNPHLILLFRDPVAVTVRNTISELFDPFATLSDTAAAQLSVVEFVRGSDCSCLLMSYEKALIFPEGFVDALAAFCGLAPSARTRQRMIRLVEPNPETYVRSARRQFAGSIDTLRNGKLHGWCCQLGELEPVSLDLFLDGVLVATAKADRFRPDLRDAGFGNGNHGFCIDLAGVAARDDAEVRLVVSGRTFVVPKSGQTLGRYVPEAGPPAAIAPQDAVAPPPVAPRRRRRAAVQA